MAKIVIISDLHLASDVCRSEMILKFLNEYKFKTNDMLVLNGDVMDNLNFKRLSKGHWRVLKRIRSISKWLKVVWIKGNHDTDDAEIIANLIGVEFRNELPIAMGDKNVLITHGDKFDFFMKGQQITAKVADFFYKIIQCYDKWVKNDYYFSSLVKTKSKVLIRCGRVIENAITYAMHNNIDVIICGHTHLPDRLTNSSKSVEYYNSGSWCNKDHDCHYITIENNEVELHVFGDIVQRSLENN
jgi:UDP-2,3-diacylglucosamine pyrophosphatase LpxH